MGKYTVIVSRRADTMLVNDTRFLANVSVPAARELVKEYKKYWTHWKITRFSFRLRRSMSCRQVCTERRCFTSGIRRCLQ